MNLGFVGLGVMGQGIVPRLMAAGHGVTGWNRSKDKAKPLIDKRHGAAPTPPRAVAAAIGDRVLMPDRRRSRARGRARR